MKKVTLVLFILTLSSFISFGQKDSNKVIQKRLLLMSLSGGVGVPLSTFANSYYTTTNNVSSFAMVGESFTFFCGISKITQNAPHFGLGLLVGYNSNPLDVNNYLNTVGDHYAAGYYNTTATATNYQIFRILPGLYFSYPTGNFSYYLKLLGGVLFLKTPKINEVDIPYNSSQPDVTSQTPSYTGNNLAYSLGFGFNYRVYKRLTIVLNVDLFHSSPSVNRFGYTIPISEINIEAGVGYRF